MKIAASFALLLLCFSLTARVCAGERVNEINNRLENQSGRVGTGLGHKHNDQKKLMRADEASYKMTAEEQRMRTRHGGKLTGHDQARLNRQLNRNSRRINNGRHQ